MSSVCGKLDFKDADFEISTSSSTQCSNGSKHHTSHFGSEDSSQESDGDETGYKNQTVNEESVDDKDFGKSTLGSLPPKSSDDEDKDESLTTVSQIFYCMWYIECVPCFLRVSTTKDVYMLSV